MHRRGRILIIVAALICLALMSYFVVRDQTTKVADRDIDGFFRDFARGEAPLIEKHFRFLAQPHEVADAIVSRHKEAIINFDYANIVPSLDVTLNRSAVSVSWHLTIVFSRQDDGWHVLHFDEFVPDSKKT
jgi:hypothetical protein